MNLYVTQTEWNAMGQFLIDYPYMSVDQYAAKVNELLGIDLPPKVYTVIVVDTVEYRYD